MHLLLLAAVALLASSESLALTIPAKETTVEIKNGTVVGKYVDSFQQELFLGIPFAQPPIDGLRFNMPQPVNETWDTPLNATEYGPECIQYALSIGIDPLDISYPQSEDCLTINVIRPAGTTNQSKLPVLVWIYGGGFQEGGTADGRYNTSYMVQNSVDMGQPTISVTINYRLDGWGLLAGDDVRGQGLANIGLHDQRLALQWIQENIEAFGGDNTRVTLQGESAGAMSIGYHMLAYGGRDDGLFSAAICQSGGPWFFASYPTPAQSEENYQSVLEATNCTSAHDSIACLRAAPFDVLDSVFRTLEFSTIPDGSLIPEYNSVALARGNFVKVPLLIGANTDEGKLFSSYGVNTTEEFREFIQSNAYVNTQNNDTIDRLMEAYPEQGSSSLHGQSDDTIKPAFPYGTQFTRVARYVGDVMFIAGRRYTCELWAQHGLPCYSYRFNTVPANTDPIARGATHFTDIAFAFDNVIGTGMDASAFAVTPVAREQQYVQLGSLISRMWTSFANSHSPNNHKVSTFNTTWPQYSLDAPTNIVFDGNSTSFIETDDFRSEAMKLIIETALDFDR